jgi:hypothetical protein
MIVLTLPLSGRQGTQGGEAESRRWPVHSGGLLGLVFNSIMYIEFMDNQDFSACLTKLDCFFDLSSVASV